jgi:predicted ATPase
MQRSAYAEAHQHLTRGLEALATTPETPPRRQHELDLLAALTVVLSVAKGGSASDLEPVLTRAAVLGQQVGEHPQQFAVLQRLFWFRWARAEFQAAQAVSVQLLDLVQRQHDPALLLGVHHAMGWLFYDVGAFALASTHLTQGIALSNAQQQAASYTTPGSNRHDGVGCRAKMAQVLWVLGYPDQALQWDQEALAQALALAHPYSLANTLASSCTLHYALREWQTTQARVEAILALATEHGFARYMAIGAFWRGKLLAMQGQEAEGIVQMRQALAALRATGTAVQMSSRLAQLAVTYGQRGQVEEGLHLLAEALMIVENTEGREVEAELHRLHGELLLQQAVPDVPHSEARSKRALAVARRQGAKSWELRAAMSLARLWQRQGKQNEAYQLLAEV